MSVESKKVIFNQSLLDFLNRSPTPFHAVQTMSERLEQASFLRLDEKKHWNLKPGQGYYTVRNGSSIIAWRQPTNDAQFAKGLRFVGAHTDSPCLKVKPQPELLRQGYFQLGVEVYGGVLLNPWFDRDLSIAGRVTARNLQGHLVSHLINFNKPLAIIPSLAIHLDREANSARSINAQTFLPPIIGQQENEHDFREIVKQHLVEQGVDDLDAVLDYELCFYDCQKAALVGLNHEFICSARLDNLLSCFIGLQALLTSDTGLGQVLICNDHEEVGSASACGAQGPMLNQWLDRILPAGNRYEVLANSLFVSADNAHGVHPNFADRHDENHGPLLNKGPVIKINANQRYASNSETSAIFRHLADQVGVPVQCFVVRSDQGCGSTIGPIVATETGIPTVDVGVPQFAMHSIRETAGSEDALGLARILQRFYQTENLLV